MDERLGHISALGLGRPSVGLRPVCKCEERPCGDMELIVSCSVSSRFILGHCDCGLYLAAAQTLRQSRRVEGARHSWVVQGTLKLFSTLPSKTEGIPSAFVLIFARTVDAVK